MLSLRLPLAALVLFVLAGCSDDAGTGEGAAGAGGESSGGAGPGPGSGAGGSGAEGGGSSSGGAGGAGAQGGGGGAPVGEPLFVAVGYGGRRMISPDGATWSNDVVVDPNGGDDDNLFRGVGWGDGVFVAVGGAADGQIFTTTDGVTWTERAAASSWLGDVAYQNGVFVAAGGNGLRQRSTDLGATWGDEAPYYAGHFRGIAAGAGVVVAAGHTYGQPMNQGLTSRSTDDGATWEAEVVGGPQLGSIAFGAGRFVAAGQSGCRSSEDGASWTDCAGVGGGLGRVVFVNGQFIVPDDGGHWASGDGLAWTHVDGPSKGIIAFGEELYLAIGWPDRIETSPDLTTFTVVNLDTGPAFTEITLGWVLP